MHQLLLTQALPCTLTALTSNKGLSCDSIKFLCSLAFGFSPVSQVVVCHHAFLSMQFGSMQHALYLESKHQPTTYTRATDINRRKYLLGLATLVQVLYSRLSLLVYLTFSCLIFRVFSSVSLLFLCLSSFRVFSLFVSFLFSCLVFADLLSHFLRFHIFLFQAFALPIYTVPNSKPCGSNGHSNAIRNGTPKPRAARRARTHRPLEDFGCTWLLVAPPACNSDQRPPTNEGRCRKFSRASDCCLPRLFLGSSLHRYGVLQDPNVFWC